MLEQSFILKRCQKPFKLFEFGGFFFNGRHFRQPITGLETGSVEDTKESKMADRLDSAGSSNLRYILGYIGFIFIN